ncbi:hypothetical protein [Pedobacter heparinus]|uniref:hypothetical protein n=1 Tax=Pedobacter heparinus TaxID=984 RepID=UPI00292E29E3|nr:hypothetical protein [Pedobacter heparinus]
MSNIIEFFCYQNDSPLEIQLEPEAVIFIASPENAIKFVAINCQDDFKWSIRIGSEDGGLQLFPQTLGDYDIEVYENNELITDFYKYMK